MAAATPAATAAAADPQPAALVAAREAQPRGAGGAPISAAAERTEAAAAPGERAPGLSGDIIARRMEATQRLLKSGATKPFSIQLLTAGSEEQLRNHLKALTKFVEVNDVYMYRSGAQGRPAVSVLWGNFSDRQSALEQLDELPRPLRVNKPYVRNMDDVRAEVGRNISR
jgi:septal ring-binding cell division protein DamX